jgi:hypothetical protein
VTLWDSAMNAHPQWHEHLDLLDQAVSRMWDVDTQVAAAAESVGYAADVLTDSYTPPAGLYGYGLGSVSHEQPVPVLFVQPGLAPFGGAPASITAVGALFERMEMPIPAGTLAIALPPPQLQSRLLRDVPVAPAMTVTIGSRRATLGLRVRAPRTPSGILTAGHAAPRKGVVVRDEAGRLVGAVTYRSDLGDVAPGTPTADVAVVAVDPGRVEGESDMGRTVDAARPLDTVNLGEAGAASWIRGVSPSFALSQTCGTWGHVAITAEAISRAGDSGAPVCRADGAVVGQIVAGYGNAYSLIQDIEYAVHQAGATLR